MDMAMAMSSSSMSMGASSTMSGMAMATSVSSGMDSMMDSTTGMMGMDAMMMVFFQATNTPLYSAAWMPSSAGQYAGTCIFLILLALIFRGLVALRCNLAGLVARWTHARDTDILRKPGFENHDGQLRMLHAKQPWSVNRALVWASLDTVLAGVSYLLMLAVMTMNVGYFLSILGGTFLGSFILGHWTDAMAH